MLRDQEPLSGVEALCHAPQGRMVLLGTPGSGKSTFVRHLGLRMATACRQPDSFDLGAHLPGWGGPALLPVLVPLVRLSEAIPADAKGIGAGTVEAFIRERVEAREDLAGYGRALTGELRETGGLVLFDGLDEVPGSQRARIREALRAFAVMFDRCRVMVTCRTHSYRVDPGWSLDWEPVHELAPLDQEKIHGFVDAWYASLQQTDSARAHEYRRKAPRLKQALAPEDPRRLGELAGTPLLLTVMALVHTHKGELPDSRVEVFKDCVDILLLRWHTERTPGAGVRSLLDMLGELGIKRIALYRALWEMAFEANRAGDRHILGAGEGRALVSEGTVRKVMHRELGDEGLRVFLDYCRQANGLLLAEGVVKRPDAAPESPPERVYAFPHLHFQEYLAARHLAQLPDCETRAAALAGDPAWREVWCCSWESTCASTRAEI